MADKTGGDANASVMQMMAKMFEAQKQQNDLLKAQMENQKAQIESQQEAMKQQNEAIQALLSERPERSDTRSEASDGLRHRGPSIDALEKQIRNFSYNPVDGVTFDTWIERHREIFEIDLKDMNDCDKGRLLLRHVDDKTYKQLVDHIRPRRPSDLSFEEILTIMLDLFGDKKSDFEKRLDVFGLKMSKLRCDDIKEFSGIVNRVVEEANIKDMPLEQFKAVVMLSGMDLPRHTSTMFHVMNQIRADEKPTLQSILDVVDVYKEVYGDAQLVANQNNLQVNAIRDNERHRDQRSNATDSHQGKRCDGCDRHHKRSECPHINAECFKCHEIGHLASKCKSDIELGEKEVIQERKVKVIRVESASRNSSFDVKMQLNGKEITMIADTGSDITIISEESWKKIGRPHRVQTNERAVCANTERLGLIGMCHIDIEMNGSTVKGAVFITESKLNVLGKDNFRKFFQLIPRSVGTCGVVLPQRSVIPSSVGTCGVVLPQRSVIPSSVGTCGVVLPQRSVIAVDQDAGSLKRTRMAGSTASSFQETRRDLMTDETCFVNSEVNSGGQAKAPPERTSGSGSTEDECECPTGSNSLCEVIRRDLMASTSNENCWNSEMSLLKSNENQSGVDIETEKDATTVEENQPIEDEDDNDKAITSRWSTRIRAPPEKILADCEIKNNIDQ